MSARAGVLRSLTIAGAVVWRSVATGHLAAAAVVAATLLSGQAPPAGQQPDAPDAALPRRGRRRRRSDGARSQGRRGRRSRPGRCQGGDRGQAPIGLLTVPAPGPTVAFAADHAKVAEALTRVVGVGTQMPPFQQYNISIWEAIRMDALDLFVRGDVVGRECRGNQPLCPTEIDMQVKTMLQDAQAQVQPVLRATCAISPRCRGRSTPCCCRPAGR